MSTGEPIFGEDVVEVTLPETLRAARDKGIDVASAGCVPLLASGKSIGTLSVVDTQNHGRRFTEDEVSLLTAFADQAALALEKVRLLKEAETEKERSDVLYRVSNLLAGPHETKEVLDLIVKKRRGSLIHHGPG
jgi:GAF domain-containing protein